MATSLAPLPRTSTDIPSRDIPLLENPLRKHLSCSEPSHRLGHLARLRHSHSKTLHTPSHRSNYLPMTNMATPRSSQFQASNTIHNQQTPGPPTIQPLLSTSQPPHPPLNHHRPTSRNTTKLSSKQMEIPPPLLSMWRLLTPF